MTFRSYLDGSTKFIGPETSMEVQAALGSDIALVFDECTPFHGGRDYTARSTERTHRWLDRCLQWHSAHGPEGQIVYGIVQGGVDEDLRRASAQEVAPGGGRRDRDRRLPGARTRPDVPGRRLDDQELPRTSPDTCWGSARSTIWCAGSSSASIPSTARCRPGSAATGWPSSPTRPPAGGSISPRAAAAGGDEPLLEGCHAPACAHGYTRAYLHYLLKAREQTAKRLYTIHNLAYLSALMAELRNRSTRVVWAMWPDGPGRAPLPGRCEPRTSRRRAGRRGRHLRRGEGPATAARSSRCSPTRAGIRGVPGPGEPPPRPPRAPALPGSTWTRA